MPTPDIVWTVATVVLIAIASLGCSAPSNHSVEGNEADGRRTSTDR